MMSTLLKYFLFAAFILTGISASAQDQGNGSASASIGSSEHYVGETLMIDGVPAYVFYVGSDGHALAFTSPASTKKSLECHSKKKDSEPKFVFQLYKKVQGIRSQIFLDRGAYINWDKHKKSRSFRNAWAGVADLLGPDGSSNQSAIEAYCRDNGIDMEEAFPAQYYASKLGKGWFIPADNELEHLSRFIYNHYGDDDMQVQNKFEITKDPKIDLNTDVHKLDKKGDYSSPSVFMDMEYDVKIPLYVKLKWNKGILSSRMYSAERGFQLLHPWLIKKGIKNAYIVHINDGIKGKDSLKEGLIVPVIRL